MIDLRSDTVTKPTQGMYEAMLTAEVGDDMVGEDPTVNRLEALAAEMFGKEAAVYACSGTQSNQMAVWAHCLPQDEILINETGHIANFEAGGPAVLRGVSCRTIAAPRGMLDVEDLENKIRFQDQHAVITKLVCLENTTNMGGGFSYPLAQIERVSQWARAHDLLVHMDGARFFNAAVVQGYSPADVGQLVDSVSVCFSKGLGCPMGSILVGSQESMARARRARKLFGGALRQSGVMAATAIYALQNHVERLAEDHANARLFAETVAQVDGVSVNPDDVETNLVFFEVSPEIGTAADVSAALFDRGIKIGPTGAQRLRACTHLNVSREDVLTAAKFLAECVREGCGQVAASASGPYARG